MESRSHYGCGIFLVFLCFLRLPHAFVHSRKIGLVQWLQKISKRCKNLISCTALLSFPLFQIFLAFQHSFFVAVQFPVQPFQDTIQFFDFSNDLLALFQKQLLARRDGFFTLLLYQSAGTNSPRRVSCSARLMLKKRIPLSIFLIRCISSSISAKSKISILSLICCRLVDLRHGGDTLTAIRLVISLKKLPLV